MGEGSRGKKNRRQGPNPLKPTKMSLPTRLPTKHAVRHIDPLELKLGTLKGGGKITSHAPDPRGPKKIEPLSIEDRRMYKKLPRRI